MKRVLITGKNSYIGANLKKWLEVYPGEFQVESISLRDDYWKFIEFSRYDVVIHTVGIAHQKETKNNKSSYFKVNRDLTYEVAQKAKNEGVKQFIFLSSMSVYGITEGIINKYSQLEPTTSYGKSKLQAEQLLQDLDSANYKIAIVRPPMVYGEKCKGNYNYLSTFARMSPVFPYIKNSRSMIYIGNLCEFIKNLIDDCNRGVFTPQNNEYICTSEMVKLISEIHGKKIWLIKILNPFLKLSILRGFTIKVFGSLVYDKQMSSYPTEYNIFSIKDSIGKSEVK